MLSITDGEALRRALRSSIEDRLKQLLRLRRDQLGEDIDLAHFAIVQPGDTAADLEKAVGFSIFVNPADGSHRGELSFSPGFEWLEDHGWCWEQCHIFDDSGAGVLIIIPKQDGIDPELLSFCQEYASEHA